MFAKKLFHPSSWLPRSAQGLQRDASYCRADCSVSAFFTSPIQYSLIHTFPLPLHMERRGSASAARDLPPKPLSEIILGTHSA
jgi:hypothetical protein